MIAPDSDWLQPPSAERYLLREQRSGTSGMGGRPGLHPAWSEPIEAHPAANRAEATRRKG